MDQGKIGKFIAEKRREKKLTQEQLAEKLGVTDRAVSNWENGKNMPDLSIFKLLCNELDISINELMSGEELDDSRYIKTLEENIITMVNDIETKKRKKYRIFIVCLIIIGIVSLFGLIFLFNYKKDVGYDARLMSCKISDQELIYEVKGLSVLNTNYVVKNVDGKSVYFFHNTINLYNKRRSNWEYSQSMARLLEGKEVIFSSYNKIDINDDVVEVYYTDENINKIKRINDNDGIREIINNSYLMCGN